MIGAKLGQVLIGVVGLFDAGAGVALLVAPDWFYANIGEFPPFNRHYAGDAGAFLLPIGVGLLIAAGNPQRFGSIIGLGLAATWLHALNHTYDAVFNAGQGQASLLDAGMILGMALALTLGTMLSRTATNARIAR
ncbi:MAG: hypothetical protein ABIZ52_03430 [Candidatus Limnocylindrales bacterium]